ncbi:hypothetical protein [Hyphobacterium marinum]|uniref:Uncharacterized protein n=1 Tax=Hyphobacterium marinum TaxID=3116574 RepID=A0ABU7LXL1_9PROT|nr:hypothetical protein [Hyphobacterium sp. Y6023]MEE2565740.1 hypothetical protein [Hyphobacterium sp. Y6023]
MFRIVFTLTGFALMALGFGASAYAFSQGAIDQAIAFTWPTAGLAVAFALLIALARNPGSDDASETA